VRVLGTPLPVCHFLNLNPNIEFFAVPLFKTSRHTAKEQRPIVVPGQTIREKLTNKNRNKNRKHDRKKEDNKQNTKCTF